MGFPTDWPAPGPIDLSIQDLPHRSATTEWWYVNSHVKTASGRDLSLFAAFFRMVIGKDEKTHAPVFGHAATWALSDTGGKVYSAVSRIDHAAPAIGLERLKNGRGSQDARLNRAMQEILERGGIPLPDRLFDGEVYVGDRRLELDFAGSRFTRNDDGSYALALHDGRVNVGCDLVFHPEKPAVRHGEDGVVRGHGGEEMFYYFIPRCRVTGTLTLEGGEQAVAAGTGWYDHEFGGDFAGKQGAVATADQPDMAWNWVALQLDDGREISAYSLHDSQGGNDLKARWALLIEKDGTARGFKDCLLEPLTWWRSTRTFHDYPVAWRLTVPEAKLDLRLEASFPDQEFISLLSDPAFWEGRCEVSGTSGKKAVTGLGYVERSGFEMVRTLDEFFGAVGEVVRDSVAKVLPLAPTFEQARDLVASPERAHYMDGIDIEQLSRTLIKPIREIADRGGKSWRSYAALACCDVVGGDSRKFSNWLALPELMHVGSLIVDDVQDRATVRRGGPACHLIYGEPLAINAGTAAYFITHKLLKGNDVSPAKKLMLYDLYFEALRAGHAGQALDLDGLSGLMADVAASGDAHLLEKRVLATHRLKTAAPAGTLARMGALVGGGTDGQVEAVGCFFEALGLAFQLIDDVLNLRGFKGDLKSFGEDIGNGTITVPVAKAMGRLPPDERRWLRETLMSKPNDDAKLIAQAIDAIERCGALDACVDDARGMVEAAWRAAEPLLDDSMPKVMLRAFGWYVLERHY